MAAVQRKLVHKQFNSPMGLYSQQNVKETLDRELNAFGDDGIEVDDSIAKPLNLANSAVLRAVEEEEEMKCGYKRVAWPPASDERIIREFTPQPAGQFSPPPQQYNPTQQQQAQPGGAPATATAPISAPGVATAPATYQGPIYNNVEPAAVARQPSPYPHQQLPQQHQQQQQYQPHNQQANQPQVRAQYQLPPSQYQQQPQYQQAPAQQEQPIQYGQSQYQRQPSRERTYEPTQQRQQTPQYESTNPYQQLPNAVAGPYASAPSGWKPIRPPVAQSGGYVNPNQYPGTVAGSEQNYASPQQQQQQPNRAPSYDQYQPPISQQPPQQPQQQQQYQPQYQNHPPSTQQHNYQPQPLSAAQLQQPQYQGQAYQQQQQQLPSWAHQQIKQQQQPPVAAPLEQQQQLQQQPNQYQPQQQAQYQFEPQQNHFDSYSQPQHLQQQQQQPEQQQQQQPYPQEYRGGSPGIITLRKEAPVSQKPAPVYASQPAAVSYDGGSKLRGDLKWPPPEYKVAAARENEERRQLALGPATRPRRVNRDYTPFFAKNAINCYYPSYKVPPGTQHMFE